MKYFFVAAFILICSSDCGISHDKKALNKKNDTQSKSQDSKFQKNTSSLIEEIESSNCVYGKYTGIDGKTSDTYESYERLLDILPDSMWIRLTFSKSPSMRVYAYQALQLKQNSELYGVEKRLSTDTSTVCWKKSDITIECSVGYLIANVLAKTHTH